jgi:histidinol dehydrogenase
MSNSTITSNKNSWGIVKTVSHFCVPVTTWDALQADAKEYARVFLRNANALDEFIPVAQDIFVKTEEGWIQAIVDLELQFNKNLSSEKYTAVNLQYTEEEIDEAYQRISPETLASIREYNSWVKKIGDAIMDKEKKTVTVSPYAWFNASYKKIPFPAVGVYVPAGQVPLPIVSGMLVQSAVCAGVSRIVVCLPPTDFDAEILVAADEVAKNAWYPCTLEIYRIGWCQAIAAMSQGIGMQPVNFIAWPWSIPVQAGKKVAQLRGTGVDAIGGPSEQMILVEDGASPEAIIMAARDMINEAEHGPTSTGIVVTNSQEIATKIQRCVQKFAEKEERKDVIAQAMQKASAIIVTENVEEMLTVAGKYGAEHIGLYMNNPEHFADFVNAPSVSLNAIQKGQWAMCTARANYGGTYHCTLPTGIYSGNQRGWTTPDVFCKTVEIMDIDNSAGGFVTMTNLAMCEKLPAHKRALETVQLLNGNTVKDTEFTRLIAEMKEYLKV